MATGLRSTVLGWDGRGERAERTPMQEADGIGGTAEDRGHFRGGQVVGVEKRYCLALELGEGVHGGLEAGVPLRSLPTRRC
jgi:hypothetical protein